MNKPIDADSSPLPGYIEKRYNDWKRGRFEENKTWFARLATIGQHPRAMVIQCCDSRVNVVEMFGAEPGDLFVLRNVANLVPPYSPDQQQHGTSAAVEYAVTQLNVAHIIVVGHSNCGGVHACHDMCMGKAPHFTAENSFIGRWMEILRPACEDICKRVSGNQAQKDALEREAILVSLRNLKTFPFVLGALEQGMLTLHGTWLDIATGDLHTYTPDAGFVAINES